MSSAVCAFKIITKNRGTERGDARRDAASRSIVDFRLTSIVISVHRRFLTNSQFLRFLLITSGV